MVILTSLFSFFCEYVWIFLFSFFLIGNGDVNDLYFVNYSNNICLWTNQQRENLHNERDHGESSQGYLHAYFECKFNKISYNCNYVFIHHENRDIFSSFAANSLIRCALFCCRLQKENLG